MTREQADDCSHPTVAELWRQAQEYRKLAETAVDKGQREEFRRLAWRYEKMAMEKRC